jgi:hypothetical protein
MISQGSKKTHRTIKGFIVACGKKKSSRRGLPNLCLRDAVVGTLQVTPQLLREDEQEGKCHVVKLFIKFVPCSPK